MAHAIYNSFKKAINADIDWGDNATTVVKVMLVTSSYAPDVDAHDFIDAVTNEAVGVGYTAGGKATLNRVITVDDTLDLAKYDADDITWATSTITARGAVLYKDTGTPATSPLIAYIDFGVDKQSSSGDFVIQWNVDGIFKLL